MKRSIDWPSVLVIAVFTGAVLGYVVAVGVRKVVTSRAYWLPVVLGAAVLAICLGSIWFAERMDRIAAAAFPTPF